MESSFYLKNSSVLLDGAFVPADLAVEDGKITAITPGHYNEKGLPELDRTGLPACQNPQLPLRHCGAVAPCGPSLRLRRPAVRVLRRFRLANTKTADPYDESLCRLYP